MTGDASPVRTVLDRAGRTIQPGPASPPIRQVLADRRDHLSPSRERTQSLIAVIRRYLGTTPGRLVLLGVILSIAAVSAGWYASTILTSRTAMLRSMIERTEPLTEGAQVLYSSLSIADASANSAFISGGLDTPGLRQRYSDALATASASLLTAAGDTGTPGTDASASDRAMYDDLTTITTALPTYSGLIETARTNNRLGNPVGSAYLGQASALMQDRILPAAQRLYERRSAAIADPQRALTVPPWGVYAALLTLVVAFLAMSRYLTRRTRRRFNVGIVAALVAIVGGLVWLLASGMLSVAATSSAKSDGAEPLRQLTEARILTQQARSAEMLALLRRDDDAGELSTFTGATTRIGHILTALGDQSSGSITATEVQRLTAALDQWTATDARVRRQMETGDAAVARVLTVGDSQYSSATSYNAVDTALVEAITTTRREFRDEINTAQRVLGFTGNGILALCAFATIALILGLIPRIREYR
ncbi:MAG: hypothetical protein QM673_13000 [Gordonia sp. (in: high G+C Gram-positive bacteria)]